MKKYFARTLRANLALSLRCEGGLLAEDTLVILTTTAAPSVFPYDLNSGDQEQESVFEAKANPANRTSVPNTSTISQAPPPAPAPGPPASDSKAAALLFDVSSVLMT